MQRLKLTVLAVLLAPNIVLANGFENDDFVGVYILDENNTMPVGVEGRMSISGAGKFVGDLSIMSDADRSVVSLSAGYRHTLDRMDFARQSIISVGGGLTYVSVTNKNNDQTDSTTDLYVESDIERHVGRSGVVHGVVGYTNADIYLGGGYTHYFTPQFGARGEIILDGPIKIGGTYRF